MHTPYLVRAAFPSTSHPVSHSGATPSMATLAAAHSRYSLTVGVACRLELVVQEVLVRYLASYSGRGA